MKRLSLIGLMLLLSTSSFANVSLAPLLNKVTLQLHAEQWVTTQTALVEVGINAAVNTQGIEKIQAQVMQKLAQLSNKGEWHLVSFDRQQDRTGLESIQITAQARLPQAELSGLRDRAKSISKPGETFTIYNVQFTPSEEEFRQVRVALRNTLYQQAKAEIEMLNKIYPDQKYYLHNIDFNAGQVMPVAMSMTKMASSAAVSAAEAAPPLAVGNKTELFATVELASLPNQFVQPLTHP